MFRSWLGALNFLLLQWFFIRLTYCTDDESGKIVFWTIQFKPPLKGWGYGKTIKSLAEKGQGMFFDLRSLSDFKRGSNK